MMAKIDPRVEKLSQYQIDAANDIRKQQGKPPLEFELKMMPLSAVKPSQTGEDYDNPSSRALSEEIDEFGASGRDEDYAPIAVDENGVIIDGNHRHAARAFASMEMIPTLVPKDSKKAIEKLRSQQAAAQAILGNARMPTTNWQRLLEPGAQDGADSEKRAISMPLPAGDYLTSEWDVGKKPSILPLPAGNYLHDEWDSPKKTPFMPVAAIAPPRPAFEAQIQALDAMKAEAEAKAKEYADKGISYEAQFYERQAQHHEAAKQDAIRRQQAFVPGILATQFAPMPSIVPTAAFASIPGMPVGQALGAGPGAGAGSGGGMPASGDPAIQDAIQAMGPKPVVGIPGIPIGGFPTLASLQEDESPFSIMGKMAESIARMGALTEPGRTMPGSVGMPGSSQAIAESFGVGGEGGEASSKNADALTKAIEKLTTAVEKLTSTIENQERSTHSQPSSQPGKVRSSSMPKREAKPPSQAGQAGTQMIARFLANITTR